MHARYVFAIALGAALMAGVPARAADTSSLSAFLSSCSQEAKGCRGYAFDLITSARANHYGCIPRDVSTDEAAAREVEWLENARSNSKYQNMPVTDVMWDGVDALWPCHRKPASQTARAD